MSNAPASPQAGGGRASMKKELPERFKACSSRSAK